MNLVLVVWIGWWCWRGGGKAQASFVTDVAEHNETQVGDGHGNGSASPKDAKSAWPLLPSCGPAKSNKNDVWHLPTSQDLAALMEWWVLDYTNSCPESWSIETTVVSSPEVLPRLCNGTAVLGGMSHDMLDVSEVTTRNEWEYQCGRDEEEGSETLSVSMVQVEVASSILAVVTPIGSVAQDCIRSLGGGLTMPQLQWMFGVQRESQLFASDDNDNDEKEEAARAILPGADKRDDTWHWSELANAMKSEAQVAACPTATDITLVGDGIRREEFMAALVESLPGGHENENRLWRTYTNDVALLDAIVLGEERVANVVQSSPVAFVTYDFYRAHRHELSVVAIQNPDTGNFILPTEETIEEGSYRPLSRRLYLNVVVPDEPDSSSSLSLWAHTRPFLEQALGTTQGQDRVVQAGYRRLPHWENIVMQSRLGLEGGVDLDAISCPPEPPNDDDADPLISIAGSSTVFPVAELWAAIYQTACFTRTSHIVVEGGGSSKGAGRVCANPGSGPPVTIGDMSRPWRDTEARLWGEYLYRCKSPGDPSRSAIQVPVAIDGLSVVTQRGGVADTCIAALGGGLTMEQLRWIFSNYLDDELAQSDMRWRQEEVIPNSDQDGTTHKWSELLKDDERCPDVEIRIAGADVLSGTHQYFTEQVFVRSDKKDDSQRREDFDASRPYLSSPDDEQIVQYLMNYDNAIAYFGYAYYSTNRERLSAVAIQNPQTQDFVHPNAETVADGSYHPLSRLVYMNLLNDPQALQHSVPFVTFGLSTEAGSRLVQATGYSLVANRSALVNRLVYHSNVPVEEEGEGDGTTTGQSDATPSVSDDENDSSTNRFVALLAGILGGIGGFVLIILCFFLLRSRAKT